MLVALIFVAVGFPLLIWGGDVLVDGSVTIARRYRISPAIISATIVAVGTSMPEAVVSLLAALKGSGDIAVANVVGSNILNICVALGCTAVVSPILASGTISRIEAPCLAAASIATLAFMWNLEIARWEGLILFLGMIAFSCLMIQLARGERAASANLAVEESGEFGSESRLSRHLLKLVLGFLLLILGGNLVLEGAITIAQSFGISERIIGLTIVAVGTSLPEIVTSIIAAIRKEHAIVLGNVIGSNIYNILLVLGASAAIIPLNVSPEIMQLDVWVMLGVSLAIYGLLYFLHEIPRWAGAILTITWITYTGYLIAT